MTPLPVTRALSERVGLIARFDGAFSAQMVRHADITQHRDRPQARLWPTRRRASLARKAIVSGILAPAAPGLTLFALMVARYLGFTLAMQRAKAAGAPGDIEQAQATYSGDRDCEHR